MNDDKMPDVLITQDFDKGEVRVVDQYVTEIIKVRDGMIEAAVREIAAAELRRHGYTVIPHERVGISLLPIDYDFIATYDPDRERAASRADMVEVLREIQILLHHGKQS